MKEGNWIPLSKKLLKELPDDRPFSKVEAMYSLGIDYDCGRKASIAGYAKLWKWSREKVRNFLDKNCIVIKYEGNKYGQKKGQVTLQVADRSESEKRQVVFVDSKGYKVRPDRSAQKKRQVADRSPSTTINPNPNPKEKKSSSKAENFEVFWNAFNDKRGKSEAKKSWNKIKFTNGLFEEIIKGAEAYAKLRPAMIQNNSTPKMAQGWLTDMRWEDEFDTGGTEPSREDKSKNLDQQIADLKRR